MTSPSSTGQQNEVIPQKDLRTKCAVVLVHIDDGHGPGDPVQLVLECTGEKKKEKAAKVATAKHLWTPAVNNSGAFGRWEFYEATDPWNLATELRELLRQRNQEALAGTTP